MPEDLLPQDFRRCSAGHLGLFSMDYQCPPWRQRVELLARMLRPTHATSCRRTSTCRQWAAPSFQLSAASQRVMSLCPRSARSAGCSCPCLFLRLLSCLCLCRLFPCLRCCFGRRCHTQMPDARVLDTWRTVHSEICRRWCTRLWVSVPETHVTLDEPLALEGVQVSSSRCLRGRFSVYHLLPSYPLFLGMLLPLKP